MKGITLIVIAAFIILLAFWLKEKRDANNAAIIPKSKSSVRISIDSSNGNVITVTSSDTTIIINGDENIR